MVLPAFLVLLAFLGDRCEAWVLHHLHEHSLFSDSHAFHKFASTSHPALFVLFACSGNCSEAWDLHHFHEDSLVACLFVFGRMAFHGDESLDWTSFLSFHAPGHLLFPAGLVFSAPFSNLFFASCLSVSAHAPSHLLLPAVFVFTAPFGNFFGTCSLSVSKLLDFFVNPFFLFSLRFAFPTVFLEACAIALAHFADTHDARVA